MIVARARTGVFVAGREVRGSSFLGPLSADTMDASGNPTSAVIGSAATSYGKLGVTITTALSHVVWHRPVNGAGGSTALVSSYESASVFTMLRSRRD